MSIVNIKNEIVKKENEVLCLKKKLHQQQLNRAAKGEFATCPNCDGCLGHDDGFYCQWEDCEGRFCEACAHYALCYKCYKICCIQDAHPAPGYGYQCPTCFMTARKQ